MYEVQTRRKGRAWTTRARFEFEGQAISYLNCLATFGTYRKRLINGKTVLYTQVKHEPWGV